jgi:hypothetical protein
LDLFLFDPFCCSIFPIWKIGGKQEKSATFSIWCT